MHARHQDILELVMSGDEARQSYAELRSVLHIISSLADALSTAIMHEIVATRNKPAEFINYWLSALLLSLRRCSSQLGGGQKT
jgi:hypothetical protein